MSFDLIEENIGTPLLSVIVPVYNVEEYVEECLQSIVDQDYPNMEILVVNDGSTDNSLQVITKFAESHPLIKVFDKPNGGLSDTRNYGLDKCTGDFVTFVDSDDVLLGDDIYSQLLRVFDNDTDIDAVQYDVLHKWKSKGEHKRTYPFNTYIGQEKILEGYLREWIHVSVCDKIFRKSIFDNIRFPKGEISEDIAIIPELSSTIKKMVTTPIGYYGYRYREGSITTGAPNIKKIYSVLKSYHKYHSISVKYSQTKSLALRNHTMLIWSYTSTIRTSYPSNLTQFYDFHCFFRLSLWQWLKLNKRGLKLTTCFKMFVVTVLGPRWIVRIQRQFTRTS